VTPSRALLYTAQPTSNHRLRVPPVEQRPSYLTDLTEFLEGHRTHGTLNGKATEPEWNGYRLIVACSCGVTFERWVTPEDADRDLIAWARRN
jgi:hypothetical protein